MCPALLYWCIWRKKCFVFYFMTKYSPSGCSCSPLVNGLLVPHFILGLWPTAWSTSIFMGRDQRARNPGHFFPTVWVGYSISLALGYRTYPYYFSACTYIIALGIPLVGILSSLHHSPQSSRLLVKENVIGTSGQDFCPDSDFSSRYFIWYHF